MEAVGPGKTTEGAELIVKAAMSSDPRPLWVTVWGGPNTLAYRRCGTRSTRPAAERRAHRVEAARLHRSQSG